MDRVGWSCPDTPRNVLRLADSKPGWEAYVIARSVAEVGGRLDDAELVRRIRSGEPALFELVMRRYNQRLFRVLRALFREDNEAEDVLQEAYVRAFAHLGQLDHPERLASWLTHIAVHEAKARLRRRGRVVDLKEVAVRAIPSDAIDPEQEVLGKQLQGVLAAAIDKLPVGYRTVFVLRELEGLSTAEVAQSLGMSEQAVKMRLHRARTALRGGLYDRIGAAALPPFAFAGKRCDRIVAAVLERLQSATS
jgi:RNA polymerase sigma-70 factor (ECF subfamily)